MGYNLGCRGVSLHEDAYFLSRNGELRKATIQADQKLWKDPHDGFAQTLEPRKMNGDFSVEVALVL